MARIGPSRCQHLQCGRLIAQSSTRGRPRLYCSGRCRQAAAEARFVQRTGRPRDHHRGMEIARREAADLIYRPDLAASTASGGEVRVPVELQVRRRVHTGEVGDPVTPSAFGPLIPWLKSGEPDLPPELGGRRVPRDPDGTEPRYGSTEWRIAELKRLGFADPKPAAGAPGGLSAHWRH